MQSRQDEDTGAGPSALQMIRAAEDNKPHQPVKQVSKDLTSNKKKFRGINVAILQWIPEQLYKYKVREKDSPVGCESQGGLMCIDKTIIHRTRGGNIPFGSANVRPYLEYRFGEPSFKGI